ncbi:MAG: DUF5615 family PIN-like protein [Candidatus Hodarchaeota archaeon]
MKWVLDVNVTKKVQKFLEDRGDDVVTLIDLGFRRIQNGEVLQKAKELNRILISYDRDFIVITRGKHPGVVVIQIHPSIDEEILPVLEKFLNEYEIESKIPNHLMILEKTKIIIRATE